MTAWPPKPGEVTDAGAPLIWACADSAKSSTTAKAVRKATEGENKPRTAISYSETCVMAHLADRTLLTIKIAFKAWRMHAEYNSHGRRG